MQRTCVTVTVGDSLGVQGYEITLLIHCRNDMVCHKTYHKVCRYSCRNPAKTEHIAQVRLQSLVGTVASIRLKLDADLSAFAFGPFVQALDTKTALLSQKQTSVLVYVSFFTI